MNTKKLTIIVIGAILLCAMLFMYQKKLYAEHYSHPNESDCLSMNVSLAASGNWPSGAALGVVCIGRRAGEPIAGGGVSDGRCPGDSNFIRPGESLRLHGCNCFVEGGDCLKINDGVLAGTGCTVVSGAFCGSNGNSIDAPINVSCPEPEPVDCVYKSSGCEGGCGGRYYDLYECPGDPRQQRFFPEHNNICTLPPYCPPATSPTSTLTPTRSPTSVPTSLPTQPTGRPTVAPTSGPQLSPRPTEVITTFPSPRLSPTGPRLSPTSSIRPSITSTITPRITPSITPRVTGVRPSLTLTSSVPRVTPTLDFNPAMCKCDGIDVSQIFPGQPARFSAFAKVEGLDINKAQIKDITFSVAKDNSRIAKSDPIIPRVIEKNSSRVRYRSDWLYTLPQSQVQSGATYRVWADIACAQKTAANISTQQTAVLGESDEQEASLFSRIANFFARLFGKSKEESTDNQNVSISLQDSKQLQIQAIYPAQVLQKTCRFVIFQFQNP